MQLPRKKGDRVRIGRKLVAARRVVVFEPGTHPNSPVSNKLWAIRVSTHVGNKWLSSRTDPNPVETVPVKAEVKRLTYFNLLLARLHSFKR